MNRRPVSVTATLILALINVLIWFTLGLVTAVGVHPSLPDVNLIKWTMALLAFTAAGVLLVLLFFLSRRSRVAWSLTLAFFLLASLLIFFDDIGWSDLIVLVLTIAPLILLIKDRTWYRPTEA